MDTGKNMCLLDLEASKFLTTFGNLIENTQDKDSLLRQKQISDFQSQARQHVIFQNRSSKKNVLMHTKTAPPPKKTPPKTTQNKGKPAKQNKPNLRKKTTKELNKITCNQKKYHRAKTRQKKKSRKKGLSHEHRAAENVMTPRDGIKIATPVKSTTGAGAVVEG